ncbi:MAG: 50S ribosomal protein L23 [Alphaproteobacteria bacterium]|nr:50S ribosomal protein L23 [Alphaproteobacteria bacterium]
MAKAKDTKPVVTEKMYTVLTSPVVTEKSMMGSQNGQVTFRVPVEATKPEIKKAVEALFEVKVTAVNTVLTKGKTKRFKGVLGKRVDVKKAIVTLEEGQTIDVGASA